MVAVARSVLLRSRKRVRRLEQVSRGETRSEGVIGLYQEGSALASWLWQVARKASSSLREERSVLIKVMRAVS